MGQKPGNINIRRMDSLHESVILDWVSKTAKMVKCAFLHRKWPFCVFEPPLGGIGGTYNVHLRLSGKRVVYFLLVLIELFLLGATAEVLRANIN